MQTKQPSYIKVGLVIVLAIVFVSAMANSVLTIRRASPPPPPPRQAAKALPQPSPRPSTASPVAGSAPANIAAKPVPREMPKGTPTEKFWPTFTLEEIIAYDPFAIAKAGEFPGSPKSNAVAAGDPKAANSPAADDSKTAATKPRPAFTGRIQAVYQRGGQTAALIGSKTVHAGDKIEGAGRIVEVDQSGLTLEVKK